MLLTQRLSVARPIRRPDRVTHARADREDTLRGLARDCLAAEMTRAQTVNQVAEAMFYDALNVGGGESDIGLFGPRLFARDARALVAAALREPLP
jgi:hypothetical protein